MITLHVFFSKTSHVGGCPSSFGMQCASHNISDTFIKCVQCTYLIRFVHSSSTSSRYESAISKILHLLYFKISSDLLQIRTSNFQTLTENTRKQDIFKFGVQFFISFSFFSLCFRTLEEYIRTASQAHREG